ncbi:MAG: carboxypeptidase-like regulatory domain-containing protein [candidate division KSB1 bacterium]|nr:carboxypeptidase-like regulatory domain-containing protein [candidate division KSB1 bacterium]
MAKKGEKKMRTMSVPLIISILLLAIFAETTLAQTGTIKGRVVDANTKASLIGVNIIVVGTHMGAATGPDGTFLIPKIPVGSYVLRFSYIGYQQFSKTDVIVRPERITYVNVELKMSPIEMDEISVTAGYFPESDEEPTSVVNYSYEEIRRAPGSDWGY